QMLAIGRGLMAEPKLLILDEPSLGLSPILVEELFALISRINADGLAVMLVEQNVVQSLALAARAYVMENGRFVVSGPAAALPPTRRWNELIWGCEDVPLLAAPATRVGTLVGITRDRNELAVCAVMVTATRAEPWRGRHA